MKTGNVLLDSLSFQDMDRIERQLKPTVLERGEYLYSAGRRVAYAYFCIDAVVSMVGVLPDGQIIEGGVVGREGMLGLPIVLGDGVSPHHAMVQVGGRALRMQAPLLRAAFDWSGTFREAILHYAHYYIAQVTQTAVCNRSHNLEERLARWLLVMRDALGANEIPVTHEILAQMLGVHRPGVTLAVNVLRERGAIRCSRGHITISNAVKLREVACCCYTSVRMERERVLGRPEPVGAALAAGAVTL